MNDRPVPIRRILASVFVVVALVVVALGYAIYEGEAGEVRGEQFAELKLVAELKIDQITTWREGRLGDAVVSASWDVTGAAVSRWLGNPEDAVLRADVVRRLHAAERAAPTGGTQPDLYDDVILAAPDGRLLLAVDRTLDGLDAEELALVAKVVASGRPAIGDFERIEPDAPLDVDVGAPILDTSGHTIATILLSGNPERDLFPAIAWWPTSARTAETEVAQQIGDKVAILNTLRNRDDPALTIDLPISRTDAPAVAAVRGVVGSFEGTDYRGVPVIAELRPVPDSPWFVVTKVDLTEVDAAVNERGLVILPVVALTLLVTAVGLVLAFSLRQQALLRRLVLAERERSITATRYDRIVAMAQDPILLSDPDGHLVDANPAAVAAYGYSRGELLGLEVRDLRAPATLSDYAHRWQETAETGGVRFETTQRRKDGSTFPVEISASPVELDGQAYRQAFIRDISDRRASEARVRQLTQAYAVLAQSNELIVRSHDEATLFAGVCRTAVEHGGFIGAWVGIPDEATGRIEPVATAGTIDTYIRALDLRTDPADPRGRGPCSRALREGRPQYVDDFLGAAVTAPWHDIARSAGIRAAMALPLCRGGRVTGILALYSGDPGAVHEASHALLEQMADDVSFALDNLDREEARRQSEAALRAKESELASQVDELRRWSEATLGREERVIELKREVNELASRAGQAPPYPAEAADARDG